MSLATDFINSMRRKAIAIYRLSHVNALVARGQELATDLKSLQKALGNTNARIAELDNGAWAPSIDQINGKTPDEVKADAREALVKDQEGLTKAIEKATEAVTANDEQIVKAEAGKKPFTASRETLTEQVNSMLKEMASTIKPEEYLPTEDNSPDQAT